MDQKRKEAVDTCTDATQPDRFVRLPTELLETMLYCKLTGVETPHSPVGHSEYVRLESKYDARSVGTRSPKISPWTEAPSTALEKHFCKPRFLSFKRGSSGCRKTMTCGTTALSHRWIIPPGNYGCQE